MTLFLLFACTDSESCAEGYGELPSGHCVPLSSDTGDDGDDTSVNADDTAGGGEEYTGPDGEMPDWVLGDPLVVTSALDLEDDYFFEGVAAVAVSSDLAIMTGQGGWYAFNMETGEEVMFRAGDRGYDLAYDAVEERVWLGTRYLSTYCIDVSDHDNIALGDNCEIAGLSQTASDDIAADGGIVLLAAQEKGGRLYSSDGTYLSSLSAESAIGVGISGDRAVLVDDDELVLWDVSDTGNGVELDRITLAARGGDVAFDGARVLVAMSSDGVAVVDVFNDTLQDRGSYDVTGPATQVALDGDFAYSASWTGFEVAWVGADGPLVLGHEDAEQIAFGIAAKDGYVAVADWFYVRSMTHDQTLAGPEIDAPAYVYMTASGTSAAMTLKNGGAMDLEVSMAFGSSGSSYSVEPAELTLAPGETGVVVVTPDGEPADADLVLTTNDPDEEETTVRVTWGQNILGQAAEDFELTGFEHPSEDTEVYRLSDYLGQVVFIAFWAEF